MAWTSKGAPTTYNFDYYRGLDARWYNNYNRGQDSGFAGLGTWYNPSTWFDNWAAFRSKEPTAAYTIEKQINAILSSNEPSWEKKKSDLITYVKSVVDAAESNKQDKQYTGLLGQYRGVLETVAVISAIGLVGYLVIKYMPKGGTAKGLLG